MPRHFDIKFWKLIIPRQWGAHAYILSLTDGLCPQNRNNKESLDKNRVLKAITGRERLIRTRLIRSSTYFEVVVNIWQDSYHFMFKNNG